MTQIATTTTRQFNSFNAIKDAYAKQLKTPKGAIKGMFAILKHQLESEKQTKQTRFYNKVGYTIYDARSLTTYANKIEAGIKAIFDGKIIASKDPEDEYGVKYVEFIPGYELL